MLYQFKFLKIYRLLHREYMKFGVKELILKYESMIKKDNDDNAKTNYVEEKTIIYESFIPKSNEM